MPKIELRPNAFKTKRFSVIAYEPKKYLFCNVFGFCLIADWQ